METTGHTAEAAKPATAPAPKTPVAKTAVPAAAVKPEVPAAAVKPAAPVLKPAAAKAGTEPDRKLNQRSTYAGVVDTGPVTGETFEQKVARLKAVAVAAKQRAEAGGEQTAPPAATDTPVVAAVLDSAMTPPPAEPEAPAVAPSTAPTAQASATHKPTGQADRTLMIRSTYCGVVDTGPVPGETFEQKVERLRAVAAAAKQRAYSE